MAEIMVYIWLGVVVLSLIGEATTMDMTSIWFSVGGITAIISWFIWNTGTGSIILQVVLFVFISLICLCTLRKVCKKLLLRKDNEKTNADALKGTKTKLLSDITTDQKGTLKLSDVLWACVSEDGEEITAGSAVEIVKIAGNKMVVRRCKLSELGNSEEKESETPKAKTKKSKANSFKDENLL